MKLLITGANGYLGSALKRDLSQQYSIIGTYGTNPLPNLLQLDVTNEKHVLQTLAQEKPDIIIHCVGISGKFEQNRSHASFVNIEGTRSIVKGAKEINARVIYISSTAVFNGRDGPFSEEDEPETLDQYGQTKIKAEKIVHSGGIQYLIIRPSLIMGIAPYGMKNKFFGELLYTIKTGIPLEIDNEWLFAPSYTKHIGETINWWIESQSKINLLHVTASGTITKLGFAKKICKQLGINADIFKSKVSTDHAGNNILDSHKLTLLGAPVMSLAEIIQHTADEIKNACDKH